MHTWLLILGISCLLVFYNYAGYAVIVYILNKLKKPAALPSDPAYDLPTVSFIVAAYNEEDCIREKITNSLQQTYPREKIEFLFITDGSTDKTPEIIRQFPGIRLLHEPRRAGKSAALNRAIKETAQEILIFSDANTILNPEATANIIRHYRNRKTGGVAGEKKVLSAAGDVGAGEGLYWKYESFLKRLDSDFYSVVGAAGELFSIRKDLYEELPHNVILDDFVLSLRTAGKGFPVRYEPAAYAMELPSFSIQDEGKRKIRIAAGGFQSMLMLLPLLAFWKHPRLTFLYVSHRVMRWTTSPLAFILALISNAVLALVYPSPLTLITFAAQLLFYGIALLAAVFPALKERSKIARLISYFVFMNVSVIRGFFRFLGGKQAAAWEKARRMQTQAPQGQ